MTKEEGELYITLATLHAPSTLADRDRGSHDPLTRTTSGWWVYRDGFTADGVLLCCPSFLTREEAARHYCLHYGLIKP